MNEHDAINEEYRRLIGLHLKYVRDFFKQSIPAMAEIMGVSKNQYLRYEKGEPEVSAVSLKRLATTFGISVAYFTNEKQMNLGNVAFFNLRIPDEDGRLADDDHPTKVYISDEFDSIDFIKNGSTYQVFHAIHDQVPVSGTYVFEYSRGENDKSRYVGQLDLLSPTDEHQAKIILHLKDNPARIVERHDVFVLEMLVGEYKEIQPELFIKM
ncbi:MAG: helix-turn-helix transcriptional regulator [Bacilli bacterium]|nr:helix-turn-helix transcriptional regulator [Bacilli bacterium]